MIGEIIRGLIGFTVLFFCAALLLTSIPMAHAEDFRTEVPRPVVIEPGCGR